MHPELFKILSFPIHSYGLMLALSFLFGIWYSGKVAKKRGLNPEVIADVGFWIILSAIVGSRAYYVLLHWEEFQGNLLLIVNPFQNGTVGIGGLVMLGGFFGAIIAGILYFKIKKIPFLPYADAMAASAGFGIMLTRIGCFLNGCCYGAASHNSLCVHFPADSPAGFYQNQIHAAGLYPSQLFESFGGLIIALIILFVGSRKNVFTGLQFYLLGLFYAVLRFVVDFSRVYSETERPLGSLSHNQIFCIALFLLFAGLIVKGLLFKDEKIVPKTDEKSNTPNQDTLSSTAAQK